MGPDLSMAPVRLDSTPMRIMTESPGVYHRLVDLGLDVVVILD